MNVRKGWCTLRTFSLLKGLPLYSKNGKKIGEACDLTISEEGKVTGVLLSRSAILKRTVQIPLEEIELFESDGIYLKCDDLTKIKPQPYEYTLHHKDSIAGKQVIGNRTGKTIGVLEDVYFTENLGNIVAYEISNGFFSDLTDGKLPLSTHNPPSLGEDTIVIPEAVQ